MKDIKKLTVDSMATSTYADHQTPCNQTCYILVLYRRYRVLHTGIAQVAARAAKPYTQYVPSELCKQSTRTFSLLVKLY